MISIEQLKMNEEFGWNEDSRATSREASNEAKKLLSKDRRRLYFIIEANNYFVH